MGLRLVHWLWRCIGRLWWGIGGLFWRWRIVDWLGGSWRLIGRFCGRRRLVSWLCWRWGLVCRLCRRWWSIGRFRRRLVGWFGWRGSVYRLCSCCINWLWRVHRYWTRCRRCRYIHRLAWLWLVLWGRCWLRSIAGFWSRWSIAWFWSRRS